MRVLIATVTAGAGHLQAAAALEEAWREFRPADEVLRSDVLAFTSALYRKSYSTGYVKVVERAPELYGLLFRKADNPALLRKVTRVRRWLAALPADKFVRHVRKFRPDLILSTHFMPPEVLGGSRTYRDQTRPPLVTVVTDFEAHALWLEPSVDTYCVATEQTAARFLARGVPAEKVRVTGIPIARRFSQPVDVPGFHKRMGWREDLPLLLVLGGGFGMGPVREVLDQVCRTELPLQVAVVCGRNEELRRSLAGRDYALPVHVLGFVSNMQELMASSVMVVTKPGGLTTAEALALGKPLLIVNPIPGQEAANSDFLLEHGAAAKVNCLEDLPFKLKEVLAVRRLKALSHAAAGLGRPDAARQVCLAALACHALKTSQVPGG
jgi:processive 1,2-diacylglycerol beta-glucosyltransferase